MTGSENVISRILLISPEQNELLRRNHSRIFIFPENESIIDAMIFQGSRPMEAFLDAAQRAVEMCGLDGDAQLAVTESKLTGGTLQNHIISSGWLTKPDSENQDILVYYDMVLEVSMDGHELRTPNIQTITARPSDSNPMENPLIMQVGVEALAEIDENESISQKISAATTTNQATADQATLVDHPVPAPAEPVAEPHVMARQAGKPGRVRDPLLDGRLKANRLRRQVNEEQASR